MIDEDADLAEYSFYRDLIERVIRQFLQVIGPILAVVASTGQGFDVLPAALAVVSAVALTVFKAVFNVKAPDGSPVWRILLDRVGSAVAGTLIGFIPADAMDLLNINWRNALVASAVAALIALASYYGAPPAMAEK